MRAKFVITLVSLVLGAGLLSAQQRDTLDIYVVDTEGGNATLFVPPSGESVLMTPATVEPTRLAMSDASWKLWRLRA